MSLRVDEANLARQELTVVMQHAWMLYLSMKTALLCNQSLLPSRLPAVVVLHLLIQLVGLQHLRRSFVSMVEAGQNKE